LNPPPPKKTFRQSAIFGRFHFTLTISQLLSRLGGPEKLNKANFSPKTFFIVEDNFIINKFFV
jgi:hypothetical protein